MPSKEEGRKRESINGTTGYLLLQNMILEHVPKICPKKTVDTFGDISRLETFFSFLHVNPIDKSDL